jgi:hypothetical protein
MVVKELIIELTSASEFGCARFADRALSLPEAPTTCSEDPVANEVVDWGSGMLSGYNSFTSIIVLVKL